MSKIAIDIGYGDVKVATKSGVFKFPTAISIKKNNYADFGKNTAIDFEGKQYEVANEEAMRNAITTRDFSFIEKYTPLLIYKAILLSGINIHSDDIELATGLSLLNWKDKDKFIARFVPQKGAMQVDGESIKFKSVELYPQGQGIFLDYFADSATKIENSGLVVVIDIGYNTKDFLVFENSTPLPSESYASEDGANIIITQLQTMFNSRFDIAFTEQEVKNILLNKKITIAGKDKDISPVIEEEKLKYHEAFMQELKAKKRDVLNKANTVIISGGGAYLLDGLEFPDNVVFSKTPFEFANVRGYLRGFVNG